MENDNRKKVSMYEKYNGFEDAYIFENGDLPDAVFERSDWSLISELIGNIILLQSGQAIQSFQLQLKRFIEENTENADVVSHLMRIAKKRIEKGGNGNVS